MQRNLPSQADKAPLPLSRRKFFTFTGIASLMAAAGSLLPGCSTAATDVFTVSGSKGKAKNILILTGSPRVQGNSDLLAEAFAKGARESGHTVNLFHTGRNTMSSCLACDSCWSTGNPCVLEDGFDKLWPLLEQAEMLVLCSPLYCYSFSGHIKCAMDRMYPYGKKNKLRDLRITESMLLMCGQTWLKKSFDGAAESYRQLLGYVGWKDRGRLFVTSVHEQGEIAGNSALKTAEKMGKEA